MNLKTILAFLCGRNRKKELYDLRILQAKLNQLHHEGQFVLLHQDAVGIKRVQNEHIKVTREKKRKLERYEQVWGKVEL